MRKKAMLAQNVGDYSRIKDNELHIFGWWSPTTSKHVNYVANYYNLKKIYND